ncbi:MerR family transcriptional regulator [Paenibacillus maysiensis]|uniref:MerR family transcriptional regulator n=1 Tax=Paenibacillus maysiensis TaxID=1155954 RepID=UPI00046E578F|nr:MerR family transcriptional regulator [Paenibacillus maysiensis]
MYSIGEIAKLTGITAFTLRYYEKIGVLPKPRRQDGKRSYDEQDLQYVRFIHGLKETGMSLENIAAFTEDGCLLTHNDSDMDICEILYKRINMLDKHIDLLEQQMKRLESVKAIAHEKSAFYSAMLKGRTSKRVQDI